MGFLKNTYNFVTRPIRDLIELGNITQKGLNVKRVEAPIFTQQELLDFANNGGSAAFRNDPRNMQFQRDLSKSQAAYDKVQNYKPIVLEDAEMAGLLDYDRALKDAAIVGSMMMPGVGSGIGGAIATGALSGAMGGYGGSARGQELGATLGGAAFGGLTGAAGYGIANSKIGQKLFNNKGKQLSVKDLFGQEPGTIDKLGGMKKAEEAAQIIQGLFDEYKLPYATRTQQAQSLVTLQEAVGKNIGDIIAASTGKVSGNVVKEAVESSLSTLNKADKAKIIERATKEIAKMSDDAGNLSAKGLDDVIGAIENMSGGFEKLAGQGGQKEAAEIARETMRKILVEGLDTGSGQVNALAPQLAKPKSLYSVLKTVESPMNRLASSAKRGMRVVGVELPLTGELFGPISDVSARGAKGVVSKIGKGLGSPTGFLSKMAENSSAAQQAAKGAPFTGNILNKFNQSLFTGPLAGVQANSTSEQGGIQEGVQNQEIDYSQFIDPNTGFLIDPDGGNSNMQSAYTIQDGLRDALRMMPGASESEALSLAKALVDQNAPQEMSSEQIKLQGALNIVDEIESMVGGLNLSESDLGAAAMGTLNKGYGAIVPSSDAAVFSRAREGFVSMISKALGEVGVLTDKDVQRAVNLIPDLTDTPQSAQDKIERLRSLLGGMQALYGGGMSGGTGYGSVDNLGNLGYGNGIQ